MTFGAEFRAGRGELLRNETSNRHAAIWLVKSSDRILGPFTEDDVVVKLRSREIMIIDEVARPMSRWKLIRDEGAFRDVVEEVRRSHLTARDDTELQGHTRTLTQTESKSATATVTITEKETVTSPESQGVMIESASADTPSVLIDQSSVKDADFVDISDNYDDGVTSPRAKSNRVRQYGVGDESVAESERASRSTRAIAWMIAVFSLAGAAYGLFHERKSEDVVTTENIIDSGAILADAELAWHNGDFSQALKLYRQLNQLKPRTPEVVSRLAVLLIQLEVQTVHAKRLLTDVIASFPQGGNPVIRSDLENGLGLAALVGEEFSEAVTHFQSAIAMSPSNASAQFNSAMAAFQSRAYEDAEARFASIKGLAAAPLMRARSGIVHGIEAREPQSFERADQSLTEFINGNEPDFRQEALVLGAFASLRRGDKVAAAQRARAALDIDPEQTTDHWHDPFLFLEGISWRSLKFACQELADELRSPVSRAVLGLCLFKMGQRTEAAEVIQSAIAAGGPNPQLLHAVNASMLASIGRFEDARAALKIATKGEAPLLAHIVSARICSKNGDLACSEQVWREVLLRQPSNLAALTGVAEARLARSERSTALASLEKALKASPLYLPALTLKGAMERK